MSKKNKDIERDEDELQLKDFFSACLRQWKWFLLSLIIFTAFGIYYVQSKEPVYSRSMEILVKDQEQGGGISDVANSFSQLGLVSNNPKVYNELIAFTSPAVMKEVVRRLDLTMNYNMVKGLHPNILYGANNPIKVIIPDFDESKGMGFKLYLQPDGSYVIKKLWYYGTTKKVNVDGEFKGRLSSSPVKTPVGNIIVESNPEYTGIPIEEEATIEIFRQGFQLAVENYAEKLKGDLTDQDADVIKLSIDDVSIQRADDILNTVVSVYTEKWIEDKNKVAIATSKFISDRLVFIEKELGDVDEKISEYKSKMQVPNFEEATKSIFFQDQTLGTTMMEFTNALAMSAFLKDYLEDPANNDHVIPMNTGTQNEIIEKDISTYNDLLLMRNNIVSNSSASNPLIQDYDNRLAGLRKAIIRSMDAHIANLKNTIANMNRERAKTKQELAATPMNALGLLSGERQQLVMQELYLYLLQKREETELTQSFTADNTRIITPPYGLSTPVAPRKKLLIAIAVLIGLAVPAASLFLAEASNTKVRSKKDLENMSFPFAGEIPQIGNRKRLSKLFRTNKQKQKEIDKPKIVVGESKRDIPNEAFRVVRSNIDFMLEKGKCSVLAFTSFNPGSGKSFVAYNLGASFALKGKRVLLVDGDLRHGSISTYVNSPRKGISNYLTGVTDDWQAMVVKVAEMHGLEVLPIGHRPPNPAELLDNGRIKTLLEQARAEYDVILLDCPPVNVVVDTQIINQYVDRTIFVVRAGLLEKKALRELENVEEEKKLKNVAILLNATTTQFSSYYTYGNYEAIDK